MELPYLLLISLVHIAFAAVFLLLARRSSSPFLVYFAVAWQIEAVRTWILVAAEAGIEVSESGYLILDLLYIPTTVFLILAVANFAKKEVSKRWLFVYVFSTLGLLILIRSFVESHLSSMGLSADDVNFWITFAYLVCLLIPGGLIRMFLGWMILREGFSHQMEGAVVAGIFFVLHGVGSFKVPFYWLWDLNSTGQNILWFLEILGLSISTIILVLNQETRARQKTADKLSESERRLTTLIGNLPGMAYRSLTDESLTPVFVSEASLELTEIPASEIIAQPQKLRELIVQQERDSVFEVLRTAVKDSAPFEVIYRAVTPSGGIRWYLEKGRPVESQDGKQTYLEGFISDITELHEAQNAIVRANDELSVKIRELELRSQEVEHLLQLTEDLQLCKGTEEVSQVVSRSGDYLFPGSSGCVFLINAGESSMRPVGVWNTPEFETSEIDRDLCWAIRRSGGVLERTGGTLSICPRMRQSKGLKEHVCIPLTAHGETLGVLHVQADQDHSLFQLRTPKAVETLASAMAEQIGLCLATLKLQAELAAQAIRDPLTGLFNRRYLFQSLEREFAQADRYTNGLGFLMIDVDHFKEVNDTYGHGTGDELLVNLSMHLQKMVRAGDFVCRYGGEEFLVVLQGASVEQGLRKAEEIRLSIENSRFLETDHPVTVSIGSAAYPANGLKPSLILREADRALYQAKNSGRNQCCSAPAPGAESMTLH